MSGHSESGGGELAKGDEANVTCKNRPTVTCQFHIKQQSILFPVLVYTVSRMCILGLFSEVQINTTLPYCFSKPSQQQEGKTCLAVRTNG